MAIDIHRLVELAIDQSDVLGVSECTGHEVERWTVIGARLRESLELIKQAQQTPQERLQRKLAITDPQARKELKRDARGR